MTLKLKSGPAALDAEHNQDEYLTTIGTGRLNPEEVLAQTGTGPAVLVAVAIVPKETRTGLLEERGDWLHAAWSSILEEMPVLQGCRMGWDSFFFVAEMADLGRLEEISRRVLLSLRQPDLESRCILSVAEGTPQEKGRLLFDEMAHDLTAEGVGVRSRFEHVLIDGAKQTKK